MPILSPVQALALDDETRIAADVIAAGVHELRRIDESNDRVFAPMLLLSVGFERLLKLTLVLYELARSGKVPSSKALRQHGGRKGHDLAALTSAVVARGGSDEQLLRRPACKDDLPFLREDEVLTYAVATLAEFGTTSRYYHLDTLLDSAGSDTALTGLERLDPLAAWGALEQALVARHHDRSRDSGPDSPSFDYAIVATESTALFQRYARAISRMWTLGSLGATARQFSGHLYPFIMLRDEDLKAPAARRPDR